MKLLRISAFVVALLPLVAAAQPAWLDDGLVAYYPFDANMMDYSGNGHHGSSVGNAELSVYHGRDCLNIDGPNSFVEIPHHTDFNTLPLTISP